MLDTIMQTIIITRIECHRPQPLQEPGREAGVVTIELVSAKTDNGCMAGIRNTDLT